MTGRNTCSKNYLPVVGALDSCLVLFCAAACVLSQGRYILVSLRTVYNIYSHLHYVFTSQFHLRYEADS